MTLSTDSARAAANSSASACGLSSTAGSFNNVRSRSPTSVPPGSRTPTQRDPSASHSIRAWVVFPDRSMPSKVTNRPPMRATVPAAQAAPGRRPASMPRLMRALVTGGAGFIGSNLVDALLERGDEVTVVDDISTGRRENLTDALEKGAELVESDIRDAQAMRDVL